MSFAIALSGINAINTELDTISNNIANSGTFGFKSSRANFSAMVAGTLPTGAEVSSLTQTIDAGGSVLTTGRGMDVMVGGRGFFVSRDSSGQMAYSRVGMFTADKDGFVIDGSGRKVQGYAAVAGSTALGAMGDLTVPTGQIPAAASTRLQYTANLSSDWTVPTVATFDPTDPQSFSGSQVSVVYDSLGAKHSLTQYFVKSATVGDVDVHYSFDGAALGTAQTMSFGTDGQLSSAAVATLTSITPTGADPLVMKVDYTGTTQFAGQSTISVNAADGYASGNLTGTQISDDGSVMAKYSNGQKQRVGTVALATFPNEAALVPISDTSWTASNASGNPLFFAPGTGMADKLNTGAIEQSNVNMTEQLVGLMSAQRDYQANTKVISTESQMMQALMQAV